MLIFHTDEKPEAAYALDAAWSYYFLMPMGKFVSNYQQPAVD